MFSIGTAVLWLCCTALIAAAAYLFGYFRGIYFTIKDYHRFLDDADTWLDEPASRADGQDKFI